MSSSSYLPPPTDSTAQALEVANGLASYEESMAQLKRAQTSIEFKAMVRLKRAQTSIEFKAMVRLKRAQRLKRNYTSTTRSKLQVPPTILKRRWDEMHHDILVSIMKLTSHGDKSKHLHQVCKSWRYALFDSLFPPGDVLDLRFIDQYPVSHRPDIFTTYFNFIVKVLSKRQYTTLILSNISFRENLSKEIAKRLPALKCVAMPTTLLGLSWREIMIPYWPGLVEVHCKPNFVRYFVVHCKKIRKLYVDDHDHTGGSITNDVASMIAYELPELDHLALFKCFLSSRALSIILDGQKRLEYLDTRHAIRFHDEFITPKGTKGMCYGKSIGWNYDDKILTSVARISTYLECSRESCSQCRIFYP